MEIGSVRDRDLRRFLETGAARGLIVPGRIRNMIAYLLAITEAEELRAPPSFGAHQLTGSRAGTWSLVVTRNWRMTFTINADNAIEDLDLEDYHGH